ncbi:hypothetical protein SLE2022_263200 [Rubroshorea leprosula]
METKADEESLGIPFMSRFGFDKQYKVPSHGRASGLWLFWKSSLVNLEVVYCTSQFIHCSLQQQRLSFLLTFAYVQPHEVMKAEFWSSLANLASSIDNNWFIMGDLNDIATVDEASLRAFSRFSRAQRF